MLQIKLQLLQSVHSYLLGSQKRMQKIVLLTLAGHIA